MLLGPIAKLCAGAGHHNIVFVAMLLHVVALVMNAKRVHHVYGIGRLSFFFLVSFGHWLQLHRTPDVSVVSFAAVTGGMFG